MQNRTKILIAAATPIAAGVALAGLAVATHQPDHRPIRPATEAPETAWRDLYPDQLCGLNTPSRTPQA